MIQLNQKLDIPFNWDKLLIYSVAAIGALFVVGGLFKIRVVLALAELGGVVLLTAVLTVFFVSVVRKYAIKPNDPSN